GGDGGGGPRRGAPGEQDRGRRAGGQCGRQARTHHRHSLTGTHWYSLSLGRSPAMIPAAANSESTAAPGTRRRVESCEASVNSLPWERTSSIRAARASSNAAKCVAADESSAPIAISTASV